MAQLPSTTSTDFFYVQKIVMSRGSSQRLYAATRTGVFRSVDAGGSWTKVLDGTALNGCMDLAIQTDRALAMVFAACGTFVQSRISRALDTSSPQTWTSVLVAIWNGSYLAGAGTVEPEHHICNVGEQPGWPIP